MSGARWTTGIGIAVGGIGGALAALMGAPQAPPAPHRPPPPVSSAFPLPAAAAAPSPSASTPAAELPSTAPVSTAPVSTAPASAAPASAVPASTPPASAAPAPAAPSAAAAVPLPGVGAPPPLDLPTTRDGLLKAEMLCDQKKDFDECARAAESLEKGTTGPADADQAKRFRRIALTHLVMQCEGGAPHACFVLAAKYRAGTELSASTIKAETLEQRALDLCKKRPAPECPPP